MFVISWLWFCQEKNTRRIHWMQKWLLRQINRLGDHFMVYANLTFRNPSKNIFPSIIYINLETIIAVISGDCLWPIHVAYYCIYKIIDLQMMSCVNNEGKSESFWNFPFKFKFFNSFLRVDLKYICCDIEIGLIECILVWYWFVFLMLTQFVYMNGTRACISYFSVDQSKDRQTAGRVLYLLQQFCQQHATGFCYY